VINPELHFNFSPEILQHVEGLLTQFSLEKYIIEASAKAQTASQKSLVS
jgi:hypothetical protein